MGPAFFNEYEARADYYDRWLMDQMGDEKIPDDPESRHALILKFRREAYERLCDDVYEAKGYTKNAIPLLEIVEKFDLLDQQARQLLEMFGLQERKLSN